MHWPNAYEFHNSVPALSVSKADFWTQKNLQMIAKPSARILTSANGISGKALQRKSLLEAFPWVRLKLKRARFFNSSVCTAAAEDGEQSSLSLI